MYSSASVNIMHELKELAVSLNDDNAAMPVLMTTGAAGYDLTSCESGIILGRSKALISTGLIINIPKGYCGQIWSRSGLSVKYSIETGAGIIDSDYNGIVKVVLYNHSNDHFEYTKGMRIAQLLIVPITTPCVIQYDNKLIERFETNRIGGFGSTGPN